MVRVQSIVSEEARLPNSGARALSPFRWCSRSRCPINKCLPTSWSSQDAPRGCPDSSVLSKSFITTPYLHKGAPMPPSVRVWRKIPKLKWPFLWKGSLCPVGGSHNSELQPWHIPQSWLPIVEAVSYLCWKHHPIQPLGVFKTQVHSVSIINFLRPSSQTPGSFHKAQRSAPPLYVWF